MAVWVFVIFLLGLLALVFDLFNVFQWFTPWWGTILMILSFGMLSRIWQKERECEREKLRQRIEEIESLLKF